MEIYSIIEVHAVRTWSASQGCWVIEECVDRGIVFPDKKDQIIFAFSCG
jgi:hypothetical protein